MAALNFQTNDIHLQLNRALFRRANGHGYIPKPPEMRPAPSQPGRESSTPPSVSSVASVVSAATTAAAVSERPLWPPSPQVCGLGSGGAAGAEEMSVEGRGVSACLAFPPGIGCRFGAQGSGFWVEGSKVRGWGLGFMILVCRPPARKGIGAHGLGWRGVEGLAV